MKLKNRFIRRLIVAFLIFCMVLSSIPIDALAEIKNATATTATSKEKEKGGKKKEKVNTENYTVSSIEQEEIKDLKPGDEIVEKRTLNSKFFYKGNNTITEHVYFDQIHKKGSGGKLEEVSSKIKNKKAEKNILGTENALLNSSFLKKMKKGEYAIFEKDGHAIKYSILEASGTEIETIKSKDVEATFSENVILHKGIFPGVDLRNITFGDNTKEDIILNEYSGLSKFTFQIDTDLKAEIKEDQTIEFLNDKEEVIFHIPAPFMEDSNYDDLKGESQRSENVSFELEKNDSGYLMRLIADEEWLKDPERVYPVYIDPSTSVGTYMDSFVMSKYPTTNYSSASSKWDNTQSQYILKVGNYDSTTGEVYAYLRQGTDGLTAMNGYLVEKAELKVYVTHAYYVSQPNGLWLDKVNSNWSADTLNWNNKPSSTNITSLNATRDHWVTFNVTDTVKSWAKQESTNYGFKLHTNGNGQTHWKKVVSATNADKKPYLEVTYKTITKPSAPTVKGYTNGVNSASGYFDLSWNKVDGADGYKVAIFNGKSYDEFDVGNVSSWSTKGKKIWPTVAEIKEGRYGLHKDGKGTEFPNDPTSTYVASGNVKDKHNYIFKLVAYNNEYKVQTESSDAAKPKLADSTAPNMVTTPSVTITNGSLNSGDTAKATIKWTGVNDLPEGLASGIDYYEIEKNVGGIWSSAGRQNHLGSGEHSFTISNLPDYSTLRFRVKTYDKNGNYTPQYTTTSEYVTKDRTRPSIASSVSVNPSSWSNKDDFTLSWQGITDNRAISNIQYKVGSGDWMNTGSTSVNGSIKLSTSIFSNGANEIHVRGVDQEGNEGLSTSTTYLKDKTAPSISLTTPVNNQTIDGIVEVKGKLTDDHSALSAWKLEVGEGTTPSTFNTIHSGNFLSSNDLTYSWNTSELIENKTYTLKITATDYAGNTSTTTRTLVKSKDTEAVPASIDITSPENGEVITSQITPIDYLIDGVNPNTIRNSTPENLLNNGSFNESLSSWISNIYSNETLLYYWADKDFSDSVQTLSNGDKALRVTFNVPDPPENNNPPGGGNPPPGIDPPIIINPPIQYSSYSGTSSFDMLSSEPSSILSEPMPSLDRYEIIRSQTLVAEPNTTYKLTGKLKYNLQNAKAGFEVKIYNGGTIIDSYTTENSQSILDWTQQELTFVTPEDATSIVVGLKITHTTHRLDGSSGEVYFDEVNLQYVTGEFDSDLYINSEAVDGEDEDNLGLKFDAAQYTEGSENKFYIRAKDITGKYRFSTTSYRTNGIIDPFNDTTNISTMSGVKHEATSGSVKLTSYPSGVRSEGHLISKTKTLPGDIQTIYLSPTSDIPSGTEIHYLVSADGGLNWKEIEPLVTTPIEKVGKNLSLKAVLVSANGQKSPALLDWESQITYVNEGRAFKVQLIDPPSELTATPNVNYMTLLRWKKSSTSNVVYNIYRSTDSSFNPSSSNLVAEGISELHWNDYNLNYGKKFYYKVVAVKSFNGQPRLSLPSNATSAVVVAKDELEKRLGLQDYWGYSSFRTGKGTGYINVSSGNLVYQSTDFITSGPMFGMVQRKTFNSQSTTKTPIGYGWDFSFNTTLLKEYDTNGNELGLILKDGDGSIHRFVKDATAKYKTPNGIFMELSVASDGSVTILRKDQVKYHFDKQFKLKKISEPNNNYLTFEYDASKGNLLKVVNNVGDATQFSYNEKDLLVEVRDAADRVYHYQYDSLNDRLVKVYQSLVDGKEYAETFEYNGSFTNLIHIQDPKKLQTNLEYEGNKLKKVINPIGEFSSFQYNAGVTIITSDKGKQLQFAFNDKGNVTSKKDPLGHQVHFEHNDKMLVTHMYYNNTVNGESKTLHYYYDYDGQGNLLSIKDPLNNIERFQDYNSMNLVGKIVSPIKTGVEAITQFVYDTKGNVKESTDAEGRVTQFEYDSLGNQNKATDEYGNITTYEYDTKGKLRKINEPLGKTEEILEYDKQGNPIKIKDAKGYITTAEYDELDRLIKKVYPDGTQETWTFDLNHNLVEKMNRRGFITKYRYDELDRLRETEYPNGSVERISYEYDQNGNMKISTIDGEGRISTSFTDNNGRVIKQTAKNTTTEFQYDEIGNMILIKDGEGRIVKSVYDMLGNQIEMVVDPTGLNSVTKKNFDLAGNLLSSTNGEGKVTSYSYDKLNRLKEVSQSIGTKKLKTSYQYDIKNGSFIENKVIDPNGRVKVTSLDALGRVVFDTDFGDVSDSTKMQKSYKYDALGNMIEATQNDQSKIINQYNEMNELIKVIYRTGHETIYEYDDNGNNTKMVEKKDGKNIITTYAYDGLDRLMQIVQGDLSSSNQIINSQSIDYQYDNSHNVVKVSYPIEEGDGTRDIEYVYDDFNRLASIMSDQKEVQSYAYTSSGKVDFTTNYSEFDTGGSGYVKVDYSYNSAGLPTSIKYLENGEHKLEEYSMIYDKRGFIKKETLFTDYDQATTLDKDYKYDDIGRLVEVISNQKTTSYSYDDVGNRLSMTNGSDTFTYQYNQFNQLEKTLKNNQTHAQYQYDLRGNQISSSTKETINGQTKDVTTTYTYDLANHLEKVIRDVSGGTKSISKNYYNGAGQRVEQEVNGLKTKYYYDSVDLLYSTDANNSKGTENILTPNGTIVASKRFDGVYDNNYFFYHYDNRNSVTSIIDSEATRVKGYTYDEFGNTKEVGSSSFLNDVKFTGAVHDSSSGLFYMNARYYQPETGRFISQDSYKGEAHDPWTQHLYTYTMNSPTNFIDPTGHVAHFMAGPGGGPTSYINKDTIDKGSTKQPAAKTENKKKKSSLKSKFQGFLDYAGFVPGPIGMAADGINALVYLADGDYKNAALNGFAIVPGLGDAAKAGKMLGKGIKNVEKAKTGPKPFGTGPHNKKIAEVAGKVSDGRVIAGGQLLPEKAILTPNGLKTSRRPDILVEKPDGSIYGINVGKTNKSGAPIKREMQAIHDLEDAGIPMHFVPYYK